MSYSISPGAYWEQVDLSVRVASFATSQGAIVIESDTGPAFQRILCTSVDDFVAKFGQPNPKYPSMYCAVAFLEVSNSLNVVRVTKDAIHGGVTFVKVPDPNDPQAPASSLLSGWVVGEPDPENTLVMSDDMVFAIYDKSPGDHDIRVSIEREEYGDGGFHVLVFNGLSTNPVERYQVSLEQRTNGNGDQMYAPQVINSRSNRIGFIVNKQFDGIISDDLIDQDMPKVRMQAGTNGSRVTSAEVMRGFELFRNAELVDANILINGGWSRSEVQLKMDDIAKSRKDCMAVLDMPSAYQELQAAIDYRTGLGSGDGLGLDSSFSAIYSPDVLIYDMFTATDMYIPPSGHVAACYAYTDKTTNVYRSPAGTTRGRLNVKGVRHVYDQGARDAIWKMQINPIRVIPKRGIYVWGDTTLQTKSSALQYVNVQRTLSHLGKSIAYTLIDFVFDPNDNILRQTLVSISNQVLETAKSDGGVIDYKAVCDASNNKPHTIDAGYLYLDVYIKPTLSARVIHLRAAVTSQGASFDVAQQQLNRS